MTRRQRMPGRMPRRATDRVDAVADRVLAVLGLLAVVIAVAAGWGAAARVVERSQAEAATRTRVLAVLQAPAPVKPAPYGGATAMVRVPAVWTAPNGLTRQDAVPVRTGLPAGARVPIWVDPDGAPAAAPVQASDAVVEGVVAALGVLTLGSFLLGAAWSGVRHLTGVRNAAAWAREWEQVEPRWRRDLHS